MAAFSSNGNDGTVVSARPDPTFRSAAFFVDALLVFGTAFAVLMIGGITFDQRLVFEGIPLDLLIAVFASSLLLLTGERRVLAAIVILLIPFLVLSPSLLWTQRQVYGASKYLNFVFCAGVCGGLVYVAAKRAGIDAVARIYLLLSVALLIAAVLYKLRYGFLDRQVRYFLNGPIVFGRIMGIALIAGAFILRGGPRLGVCALFLAAVLWTGSRGPLIALVLTGLICAVVLGRHRVAMAMVIVVVAFGSLLIQFGSEALGRTLFKEQSEQLRVIFRLIDLSQATASGEGSIGSRKVMWAKSLELITKEPLGAGMGSWSIGTQIRDADYPHNIVLELLSEVGIPLTSLAVLLGFCLYRFRFHWLTAACIYLFIAQQVSGDLLDLRFLATFLVAACLLNKYGESRSARSSRAWA